MYYSKNQILEVIEKLSRDERNLLCKNEYDAIQQINSPFITYRKVHYVGSLPVAFIDGMETIPGIVNITYATIPECQNLGISSLLISELIDFYKFRKPILQISTMNNNNKTIHLCKKFGFALSKQKMFTSEYTYIYE